MDLQNRILKIETLFTGTLGSCNVYTREIIKKALDFKASSIVISHNHSCGCKPSKEDDNVTRKVIAACLTVDLNFLDHIIIGDNGFYSYLEKNHDLIEFTKTQIQSFFKYGTGLD